ncbi:MAG: glycosyltransferase family 39 protein [Desulfuromonadales bacterium]|nr:glycosyltransferase family 39 protein [Desulfuromonadales bacterium]
MKKLVEFVNNKTASAWSDILILAIAFSISFFQFLGRFPLIEPDEGRYSEIPREMLARWDFITPTLNYVKYFEKPPLLYWLNSISFSIFGQNELAARLVSAMSGFLTVLFIYWVGRRLFDRRVGLLSAIILGSAGGFIAQARINIIDMLLTFCMTLCLGSFILAVKETGRSKTFYYYLFYIAAALAVLAKGLIGIVFPGGIIFLFMLFRKRWDILREMRLITGSLLFFIIAAPWFVLVSLKNPEFLGFFFIHEHFERFLTKIHGRYEPLWFFVPVLIGTMIPWSFFIPAAFRDAWKNRRSGDGEALTYLAIWGVLIFLFFSMSDSKLVPYIMPVFPPLAVMIGYTFSIAIDKGASTVKWYAVPLLIIITLIGIGLPIQQYLTKKAAFTLTESIVLGAVFLIQGVLGLVVLHRKEVEKLVLVLSIGAIVYTSIGVNFIYAGLAESKTAKPMGLKVKELAGPDAIIASFGYDQTLPFYSGRRIVVIGDKNELEFGSEQGNHSGWFIDEPTFLQIWNSDKRVFAVLSKDKFKSLAKVSQRPVWPIVENNKKVLVTNM